MLTKGDLLKIEEIVQGFFNKMTVSVNVRVEPLAKETLPVNVKTEEARVLIGERGQTLLEIQRLLGLMLRKEINERFYLNLDVNNYKKKKIDYLKELSRSVADDVALNKEERTLPPMLSYERRIIHLELADRNNIITESVDRDPERRVIIRPCP